MEQAASLVADKVEKWFRDVNENLSPEDKTDYIKFFTNELKYYTDGYQLAKRLDESLGVYPDEELVDCLSGTSNIVYSAHCDAVKKWIKEEQIKPEFSIGDKVCYLNNKKKISGEITKIDCEMGKYLIFSESLGHVKSGVGSHGVYITFEETFAADVDGEIVAAPEHNEYGWTKRRDNIRRLVRRYSEAEDAHS